MYNIKMNGEYLKLSIQDHHHHYYYYYYCDVTAAMLVSQTNSVGVELFSYVNAFFSSIDLHTCWPSP